jgi:hypothetical protein
MFRSRNRKPLRGPSLIGVTFLFLEAAVAQINPAEQARLYCGTDNTGFSGENGQIAVVPVNGAAVSGKIVIFDLSFPLNGVTNLRSGLLAGQPESTSSVVGDTLRQLALTAINEPPELTLTIPPGPNSFSAACCDEQMVVAPDGHWYHAHYPDVIQRVVKDPNGESEVTATYEQADIVGMATDGVNIWISNWDTRQVGTWSPATNIFTPVFTTPDGAGALAWDVANGVLWVGMLGGSVIPYNATGQQLGPGFMPFGVISNTIDGLAFVP